MSTSGPDAIEVCVGAVAVAGGRLLMVRRGRAPGAGLWSVPGGHVEVGEAVTAAVERELAEETGLTGECGALLGWVERIGRRHHYVILDFEVTVDRAGRPVGGDDADEAAWVDLADVTARPLVEGLEGFLVEHGVLPPPAGG